MEPTSDTNTELNNDKHVTLSVDIPYELKDN